MASYVEDSDEKISDIYLPIDQAVVRAVQWAGEARL